MVKLLKSFFSNFLKFSGRTSRADFWLTWLCLIIVGILLGAVITILPFLIFVLWLYSLIILIPSLAMGARRLRDAGFTPLLLLLLLTGVGLLILIILWLMPKK